MNPVCVDTVLGLCTVLEAKFQRTLAITTLTTFLQKKTDANVHARLASLMAAENMFMDALRHYNNALRQFPLPPPASLVIFRAILSIVNILDMSCLSHTNTVLL